MTDQWTDRLSEYLDGELTEPESRELEAHLAGCEPCRGVLAELEQVVARARRLEDRRPTRDLWPAIASGIGSAAPASGPQDRLGRRLLWGRLALSVPQLAAAGVALALVSGGTAWLVARRNVPAPVASQQADPAAVIPVAGVGEGAYQTAVRDLERVLAEGRDRLDTATVRVLEGSLRAIDVAILEARRALAGDPGSAYLNHHLAETMRRKLDLMRRAAALAMAEI